VAELRKLIPNAIIEVDGGVNLGNAQKVAGAGADLIVAGSAIVGQGNPAENFEKLKQLIN
jgi:ribulose-phosphate 3-epimerase